MVTDFDTPPCATIVRNIGTVTSTDIHDRNNPIHQPCNCHVGNVDISHDVIYPSAET